MSLSHEGGREGEKNKQPAFCSQSTCISSTKGERSIWGGPGGGETDFPFISFFFPIGGGGFPLFPIRGREKEEKGRESGRGEEFYCPTMGAKKDIFPLRSSRKGVVREESRHREKKGGSQVTARAGERERRRYSM